MWELPVAAVQLRATNDFSGNIAVAEALIDRACQDGAKLVVLPECFAFLGAREGEKMAHAERLPSLGSDGWHGPIGRALATRAQRHGAWLVGGGIPEAIDGDSTRAYNTAVVVGPDGRLAAAYRKRHLFDVDIPGGATLRESDGTCAGDDAVVVDIDGVTVGLSICYDLRFPELYRHLVLDRGAQVLLVPAAFTAHTGKAHWHTLLRARAIENQAYVVAAAQWGHHNPKRESFGHTMIIDPWGHVLGDHPTGDAAIHARLRGDEVARVRAQMPCAQHVTMWPLRR